MLAGQVLFLVLVLYLTFSHYIKPVGRNMDKTLQVLVLVIGFAAIYGGIRIFKNQLEKINQLQPLLTEKANLYRAANITQWALAEGATLFSIIAFYLTGNYALAVLAAVLIAYFTMLAPSKLKATLHLSLNEAEVAELEGNSE